MRAAILNLNRRRRGIQGKMTSRNVLQEISFTFSDCQYKHDCLTEKKATMSLSRSQPNPSLSTLVEYTANDEHKENKIPADSRLFAKEASMYEKNATDSDFTTPKRVSAGTDLPGAKSLNSIDLSKVTVADLGISPESFTKFSGKSPKSLQKHRRRSTIGVRGSPEMNFLIRQIALQRSKVKPEPDYLSSPFTSPKNSLLKSKMSAFKDAFQPVDENEGSVPFPGSSDVNQSKNGQQERFQPPEKRMKLSHNMDFPINEPVKIVEETNAVNSCETISDSDCLVATGPCSSLSVTSEQTCDSPLHEEVFIAQSPKRLKRKVMFRDPLSPKSMSPYQVPRNEAATVAYPCPKPCLRPALKKSSKTALTLTEEYGEGELLYCTEECSLDQDENVKVGLRGLACAIDSVKKKKVTFGRELSPELFDKTLPANTPLRRGSTPYRHGTAVTESPSKSILDDFIEPLPQPDFDNAELILPLLSICFEDQEMSCNSTSSSSTPEHTDEAMLEEKPRSTTGESESVTLNLHAEHVHSPVSEDTSPDSSLPVLSGDVQTPSDITVSTTKTDSIPNCGRTTRSALKRQSYSSEESSVNGSQSEDKCSVPVSAKTVAKKTISRKPVNAKKTLIKASLRQGKKGPGRRKKSVRKPQFEDRKIVSKRPLLSPIPELPECLPTPPASVKTDMVSGKQMLKRGQKIKVAKKSRGRVYEMKDFSALKDHGDNLVIRKLDEDRIDPLNSTIVKCQIMDIPEVTPTPGGLGFGPNLSPTKRSPPQNTTAVIDAADQARGQSSEVCPVTKEPVVKQSDSAMVWIDSISISASDQPVKDKSAKARRRSDRHSVTCYSAQTHVFQDDIVHEIDVSNAKLRTEQISRCPNESAEDQYPGDSKPPGTSQQQVPVQDFANEMMHLSTPLADQLSGRQVLVSLVDNTNNFAMENNSTMSPSVDEIAAIMEDPTLYNRIPEKKVRRSMRLRRDSGTSGLFWVQEEEKDRKEKGRRRSMNFSVERQVESPKCSCKSDLKCPVEESQTMVPSAGRKSRRKTICLSALQEA